MSTHPQAKRGRRPSPLLGGAEARVTPGTPWARSSGSSLGAVGAPLVSEGSPGHGGSRPEAPWGDGAGAPSAAGRGASPHSPWGLCRLFLGAGGRGSRCQLGGQAAWPPVVALVGVRATGASVTGQRAWNPWPTARLCWDGRRGARTLFLSWPEWSRFCPDVPLCSAAACGRRDPALLGLFVHASWHFWVSALLQGPQSPPLPESQASWPACPLSSFQSLHQG